MPHRTHPPGGPWVPVVSEARAVDVFRTSHLVPCENSVERRSPRLPKSVFNNSNNNVGNALYLLNAFLRGAQLAIRSRFQEEEKDQGDVREPLRLHSRIEASFVLGGNCNIWYFRCRGLIK